MKKATLLAAALTLCVSTQTFAEPTKATGSPKVAGVAFGSIAAGAAAAGPYGAIAGMLAGIWLTTEIEEADKVDDMRAELATANDQLSLVSEQLAASELESDRLEGLAIGQLNLQMLFKTGVSDLSPSSQQRMGHLANLLLVSPGLEVALDGYSDPRGTQDYNLNLSAERVNSVKKILIERGVNPERITTSFHGASQSSVAEGDYDGYAMERLVDIKVSEARAGQSVAQINNRAHQ